MSGAAARLRPPWLPGGPSAGEGSVEAAGERDRGAVRDLVLHCRDGGDAAADEGGGGAGEQVAGAGGGACAGVQDNQAGHRAGLTQQVDQPASGDGVRAAVRALEEQRALVAGGVEGAVPDVVQYVPFPVHEQVLQPGPGRVRCPVHLSKAPAGGPGQGAGQVVLFCVGVQAVQVARGRDDAEYPQRRPDLQRRGHGGDRDVADQLVAAADVRSGLVVEHCLPGQPG